MTRKFESSSAISKGLGNALQIISEVGSLPFIRGRWIYVDPTSGSNASAGETVEEAVADLAAAYDLASDGDGIALLSYGATSAATTSYLTKPLAWSKDGITVFGVAAQIALYGRARVANKTITTGALTVLSFLRGTVSADTINRLTGSFITDGFKVGQKLRVNTTGNGADATGLVVAAVADATLTLATTGTLVTETAANAGSSVVSTYDDDLIVLSGDNNRFINVHMYNGGADALEIGGLNVSGNRNYFKNCHVIGGAGAAASASKYSLKIDGGGENTFEDCVIGTDTYDHGNNADAEVILNSTVARNRFIRCEFICYVTTGTAHGAVKSVATSGGSPTMFRDCIFNAMLSVTIPAAAFLSSGSVDKIGAPGSKLLQFTAWGAGVYVDAPAAAATAGGAIATKS